MLDFIRMGFRGFFEVWLWINLIGCTITGGKLGALLSDVKGGSHGDFVIYGVVIGAFVGISTDILVGGLIATFLSMRHDLALIKDVITKTNTPTTSASPIDIFDSPVDSALIKSGQTLSGVINHKNGHNLFHIVLTQPSRLSMKVTTNDQDGLPHWYSYVNVLDSNGKKINTSGRFEFPYSCEVDLPAAGTYTIEVTSLKTGKYNLTTQY